MRGSKLHNLVDIVLVVGADRDTGLRFKPSKQRQIKVSVENQIDECPDDLEAGSTVNLGNDYARYATFNHLTAESTNAQPQVLQMFSACMASYPHRSADKQPTGYPHDIMLGSGANCGVNDTIMEQLARSSADLPPVHVRESPKDRRWSHVVAARGGDNRRHSLQTVATQLTQTSTRPAHGITKDQLRRGTQITSSPSVIAVKTEELPLSQEQIDAICQLSFPEGLRCYSEKKDPSLTSFVLTDLGGDRFYAVTLTYYHKFMVFKESRDGSDREVYQLQPVAKEYMFKKNKQVDPVFIPNCIVLVSAFPLFDTLQKSLTTLYERIITDVSEIDSLIQQFAVIITNAPVPPFGELAISLSFTENKLPIIIRPPPYPNKSVIDFKLSILFSLIPSVMTVCQLIGMILTEQRVVFMSSNISLLTVAQEAIMTLIHPFRWQSMYVPVLSAEMIGLIEAPGYFIMGCHSKYASLVHSVEGLIVVDLDQGTFLATSEIDSLACIPLEAANSFCAKIKSMQMDFDLHVAGRVVLNHEVASQEFTDQLNKSIFMAAVEMQVDLFGDLLDHIIKEQKFFNKSEFLKAESRRSETDQVFYQAVMQTSMFKAFLRDLMSEKQLDVWVIKASEKPQTTRRSSSYRLQAIANISQVSFVDEPHSLFQLPLFNTLTQFQDDIVISLTNFMGLKKVKQSKQLLSRCLYVLGTVQLQRGKVLAGLASFYQLYRSQKELFPHQAVIEELRKLNSPDTSHIWDELPEEQEGLFSGILKAASASKKAGLPEVRVDLDNLPEHKVNEEEFYKYAERLDFATDRLTIKRLFNALTLGSNAQIEPEFVREFYECWKDNEAVCKDIELLLLSVGDRSADPAPSLERQAGSIQERRDEPVLKVSPTVRTDLGQGRVILSQGRLLFLKEGAQIDGVKDIVLLQHIAKTEIVRINKLFKDVDAVRIHAAHSSLKPFTIYFEEDCKLWKLMIDEMVGGQLIASKMKDGFVIQQAAQNTLLIQALIQSSFCTSPKLYHSSNLDLAIDYLLFYSKEDTMEQMVIPRDASKDILVHRVNPNSSERDTGSIECLLFVPGTDSDPVIPESRLSRRRSSVLAPRPERMPPTLWCGLSTGKIKIFNATTWKLLPGYVETSDRVVCLQYSSGYIWAGSFDKHVYVIERDTDSLSPEKLCEHSDWTVDIQASPDGSTMYTAFIDGIILSWDARKREKTGQIRVPTQRLTMFRILSKDEIWCCCKENIMKVDSEGRKLVTLQYIDEKDHRIELDCFTIQRGEIWAGCSQLGRIIVWDKSTNLRIAILPLDCRGVSQMCCLDSTLYIGCKASFDKASLGGTVKKEIQKSKMYILDTNQYIIIEEVSAHSDTIRSMSCVQDKYVLTGSSSREGKIAIWKHHRIENGSAT